MIECQVMSGKLVMAVLAGKIVPQKKIEAGKGWSAGCRDIFLQCDDARQPHAAARRMHFLVIFAQHRYPVEADGLDRVLP